MVTLAPEKSNKYNLKSQSKLKKLVGEYIKNRQLVYMLLPALIVLFIFCYLPMLGIVIAFKDYKFIDGIFGSDWVGLEHFITLFNGSDFIRALKNTVVISFLKLAFGFPAPIILALLLNEVKNVKFKKSVQILSYLPHFFSWVVLSGILTMIFSTNGPINIIYKFLVPNSEPLMFFRDPKLFIFMIIGTAVWQGIGWGAIIYIAALSGIDSTLYEAAYMDGANKWKQVIHISIPSIIPTIVTVFILNLGGILNAGFDQIYNMYNPMVYDVADILDTFILRKLQVMDYGVGTALGLFKSMVGLVFVLGSNYLAKKISDNENSIF